MSKIDWSKEHRQAPIGLLLFFTDTLRTILKAAWPLLIIFLFNGESENRNQIYFWIGVAGSIFVLINGLLSYWFFKFSIVNNEFIVNKGYLKKIKLAVALDRIQTINIKQNIFQKILGVVSVEIDTAGAKETEIKLIAIKEELSSEFEKAFGLNNSNKTKESTLDIPVEKKSSTIINLEITDLLKVGISENHLKNLMIVVGIVYGLFYQVEKIFEEQIERLANEGAQTFKEMDFSIYIYMAILVFLFSVFVSLVITIFKFFNFKLQKSHSAFVISFGLLNTKKINVPLSKIQIIAWHINPLRQLLKFENLTIKQAVSGPQVKSKQKIEVPACDSAHKKSISNALFGSEIPVFSKRYKSHFLYFLKSFLILSFLIIGLSSFLWLQKPVFLVPLAIIELTIATLIYLSFKKRYFRISESIIEISKGQIGRVIYQLQNYKIQSVRFKQSIIIKRRKLASIVIYTAAGEYLTIPYIPEEQAMELYNYLLYKAESTEEAWM